MTNKNFLRIVIALLVVSLVAALSATAWFYQYWHGPRPVDHQVLEIRSGSSASALFNQLKQRDVIDDVSVSYTHLRAHETV